MITKTIRTPAIIQLLFILALLPWLIACTFMIGKASASPVKLSYNICDKVYFDTFVWQVRPEYNKICKNRFQYLTNSIKRSYFINHK